MIYKYKYQIPNGFYQKTYKKGMKFVGSTIIYSYLQAIRIIYLHDKECF